jgi:asparaginyl-tRNA synthetase
MTDAFINRIGQFVGQTVSLKGWVNNIRSSGKLHFVELRDGSGFIQCVANSSSLVGEALRDLEA